MKHNIQIYLGVIITLLIMLAPFTLRATHISVSGEITTDTSWTTVDTVLVTGNVTVTSSVVLTIGAGTVIDFRGFYYFRIWGGRILAIGEADNMIYFTAQNHSIGWNQIVIYNASTAGEGSILEYCILEYAHSNTPGSVYVERSSAVRISDCIFRYNNIVGSGAGIYVATLSPITIENCIFTGNSTRSNGGMVFTQSDIVVNNCLMYGNTATYEDTSVGITVYNSNPLITNCTIDAGDYAAIGVMYGSNPTFRNCILWAGYATVLFNPNGDNNPSFYYCNERWGLSHLTFDAYEAQGHYYGDYENCINSNPLFVGTGDDPYDLQRTSPCINTGDPTTTNAYLGNYDIGGGQRIINGRVDIGAYEESLPLDTIAGNCLEFDGTGDYISGSGIDTSMGAITIEAWVYHNSLPAGDIQRYVTIAPELAVLRYDGSASGDAGELHFYVKKANGSSYSVRADSILATGEWMHIAGTYDGTDMKLYLNGKLVKSASPAGGLYSPSGNFTFSSSGETLDGKLDEVRVWNRALTANEIRQNMHLPLSGDEVGLCNYWQFNSDSGTTLVDKSGVANGTLNNMTDADWVSATCPFGVGVASTQTEALGFLTYGDTGLSVQAYQQSSATVTVVRLDIPPTLLPDGVTDAFDSQYWILHRYGTGGYFGNLQFTVNEGFATEDANTPQLIRLFWRSSGSDSAWREIASAYYVYPATSKVRFTGLSDEGQFIVCRSFYEEDSVKGNALALDGTSGYLNVGSSAWLDNNNTLTIEAWIKPEDLTTRQSIYSTRYANSSGSFQLEVGPGNGGVNRVAVTGPSTWIAQTVNNAITPGEWNHIAYIRWGEYAAQQTILVNGVAQTLVSTANYSINNNYIDKMIGCGTSGSQIFNGLIDEVRVWGVQRTLDQVREHMYLPLGDNTSGLHAYWQFNEGSGTTTRDNFAANHGTIMNITAPWAASGIPFGSGVAYSANEADGVVVFPNTSFYADFEEQNGACFTVSRLHDTDINLPSGDVTMLTSQYWIINRFGTGNFEASFYFVPEEDISEYVDQPNRINLYRRDSTSEGEWTWVESGWEVDPATNTVYFGSFTSPGQYIIGKRSAIHVGTPQNVHIVQDGEYLKITWDAVPNAATYKLYTSPDPNAPWEDWYLATYFIWGTEYFTQPTQSNLFYRVVGSTEDFGK